MEQAELERLQRRYPWSKYKDAPRDPYMSREEGHAFAKANWVASVRWIVPDASPGMYGWRCENRSFASEEAALAAAKEPMGIARSVEVVKWDWDKPHQNPERCVTIYERKNAALAKRKAGK